MITWSWQVKVAAMALVLGIGFAPVSLHAADGVDDATSASGPASPDQQAIDTARAKIGAQDWPGALQVLEAAAAESPDNADIFNLIGYAARKNNDLEKSGVNYEKALALNPKHKGALEYQGELFLALGQLDKAEANLKKLSKLCFFGCEEYTDLKNDIAEYKAGQAS